MGKEHLKHPKPSLLVSARGDVLFPWPQILGFGVYRDLGFLRFRLFRDIGSLELSLAGELWSAKVKIRCSSPQLSGFASR